MNMKAEGIVSIIVTSHPHPLSELVQLSVNQVLLEHLHRRGRGINRTQRGNILPRTATVQTGHVGVQAKQVLPFRMSKPN